MEVMVIPVIGILASSVVAVLIVALVTRSRQRRVEAQVQMQSKLIERFGSAPELVQFLHSPAGRQFVTGVSGAPTMFARERIISGFSRAIIMTALGASFVFLAAFQGERGWIVPAAVVFALGLGYLIATFVTYRFAAKFAESDNLPTALRNDA
jgi:hypothetical protein